MKIKTQILLSLSLLPLLSCVSKPSQERNPNQVIENPQVDIEMGESLEENEAQSIQNVIDFAKGALVRDFKKPNVPRDAHAKSHGCLKGFFEVSNQNLHPTLRLGLFSENKSYPAWIRFSNNTSDPFSKDSDLDLRGIAVKVMGVDGEKILENEINETTQDFLMFASPIFFVKDIKHYAEFSKALAKGQGFNDLLGRPKSLIQLGKAQVAASFERNPLRLKYFSASPYRLGNLEDPNRRPVKYSFQPCDLAAAKLEPQGNRKNPNFMREALSLSLKKDACFHFKVQLGDPQNLRVYPVEDPTVQWPEDPGLGGIRASSPYKTVATLRIPAQKFNTPELDQFCEKLSFTPWHARKEHRPLGRTNRMRRALYEEISRYRHEQNGVIRKEPTSHDIREL